jgi:hypothetical protein
MRADRPLIGAVVTLAAGIAAILVYGNGTTAFNAGYPFSASLLHIDFSTNGPPVMVGVALIAIGLLLMLWALLAAFVSQIVLLFVRKDELEVMVGHPREVMVARPRVQYVEAENYQNYRGSVPVVPVTEHKHGT